MISAGRIFWSVLIGLFSFSTAHPVGVLIGMACIAFIIYEVSRDKPQTTTSRPMVAAEGNNLTLSCIHGMKRVEELQVPVLELQITGVFSSSTEINLPSFTVRMKDLGDSRQECLPLLCVIDHLQAEDSLEFELNLDLEMTLPAGAGSEQTVNFATIPTDFLVFPYQGNRRIQIELTVRDRKLGRAVINTSCIWKKIILNSGYVDDQEEESETLAEALKLAMCLAASDGNFDDIEVKMIQDSGTNWVNALPADRQEPRKKLFNKALQEATHELQANRHAELERSSIANLKKAGKKTVLYEAYEMCLNIVKADGSVHPEEMGQLQRIAHGLELDHATVKMLSDKHLLHVEMSHIEGSSSIDKMLGITEPMSKEEIRKHLNKLFRKYQGLQAHDNEETRRKAAQWLEMIATARVHHLS